MVFSIIVDINDFENEKKTIRLFLSVPGVSNSNEIEHPRYIPKRGSKLGCTI